MKTRWFCFLPSSLQAGGPRPAPAAAPAVAEIFSVKSSDVMVYNLAAASSWPPTRGPRCQSERSPGKPTRKSPGSGELGLAAAGVPHFAAHGATRRSTASLQRCLCRSVHSSCASRLLRGSSATRACRRRRRVAAAEVASSRTDIVPIDRSSRLIARVSTVRAHSISFPAKMRLCLE
jgi:hypothetical protein